MTRIPAIKKTLTKAQSHRGELDQKLLEGGPSSPLSAFRFDLFLFLRVSAPPCEPPFRFPSASLRLCARSLFCSPFAAFHSSSVSSFLRGEKFPPKNLTFHIERTKFPVV